jgi:D-alanyl-D-alanine carboxypeptidase (penicillin-binding protein 5/6)
MRLRGRPATAFAVSAGVVALTVPSALALSAAQAAPGTGRAPAARHSAAAAGPARPGSAMTTPAMGSSAARTIGGPLMASGGIVVSRSARHGRRLPRIPASAWVIANAQTGQVLAAKDPHGEFGPASTLKVLTAVTLVPRLKPDAMVTASKLAAEQEPNDAGLIPGRAYKVAALFQALFLISANDAAVALTEAAGSFGKGMALINAEARHLQAYDVDAKLPNGLPASGQVTSAYDEALIGRQALAMPALMHYDQTLSANFEVKPHHWETLVNQNTLLTQYRGGIGGKIGWTVSSAATYVGMARRHGVTLIATVLHCTALQEITSAEKLLNWGFAVNGKVRPVGTLVPPLPSPTPSHKAAPKDVALSTSQPAASDSGYALAAGAALAAGLGLTAVVMVRRRVAATRNRPELAALARAAAA